MDDWSSSFQGFGNNLDFARRIRDRERLSQLGIGGNNALSEPATVVRDALGNVVKAPFQILGAGARSLKGMASPVIDAFNQGFKSPVKPSAVPPSLGTPRLLPIPPKNPSLFNYNF
jgi:hypothetical protein